MTERFGPYLLLKSLGSGAMGDAHLALPLGAHARLPTPLVIKRLHVRLNEQAHYLRRFQHEAVIATRIDSPHVPRVYDAGRVGDVFYIAMELVRGWSLARVIDDLAASGQRPSLHSALEIATDTLRGLDALHTARDEAGAPLSVVHRDVSPRNLMVGEDGLTRVIDLGLGKSTRQDWKTRTGAVMGSPGYMAPEQVLARAVDHRSDLYAVGVILWELLTGTVYIRRGRVAKMLVDSLSPEFRAPSSVSEVPIQLDRIAARALDHRPEHRFQSAREFLAALLEAVPSAGDREPISSLVGQILWRELADATTENRRLVDEARAEPVDTIADEATIVLARREAPEHTEVDTVVPPTRLVSRAPPPRPPVRWVRSLGTIAAIAVAVVVGIWIGRSPAPATQEAPRAEEPAPRPIVEMRSSEPGVEDLPDRRAPERPARKVPARRTRPPAAVSPPPADPAAAAAHRLARTADETNRAWLERLVHTAASSRRSSEKGTERREQLDRIYTALVRHLGSARLDDEVAKIDALARELAALAPD